MNYEEKAYRDDIKWLQRNGQHDIAYERLAEMERRLRAKKIDYTIQCSTMYATIKIKGGVL